MTGSSSCHGTWNRVASGQGKVSEINIFQGQGKVRESCEKSGKIFGWGKVREKSGNIVMNACNIFLWESTPFCSSFKCLLWIQASQILTTVLMLCDIFTPITVSWQENMCLLLTVYGLIVPSIYFASLINFHLLYCEGKSVTASLEILSVFGQWNFEEKKL